MTARVPSPSDGRLVQFSSDDRDAVELIPTHVLLNRDVRTPDTESDEFLNEQHRHPASEEDTAIAEVEADRRAGISAVSFEEVRRQYS